MSQLINLTPHAIHLPGITLPPAAAPARCSEVTAPVGEFAGVPLVRKTYGVVIGLPDPQPDTLYVVSLMVRAACPERSDLASPGDLLRDSEGKVTGAANLVVNG